MPRRTRQLVSVSSILLVLTIVTGVTAAFGAGHPSGPAFLGSQQKDHSRELPSTSIFGTGSVWRRNITTAPLASNSAAEITNLVGQITPYYGGIAAFNAHQYNVSVAFATSTTKRVTMGFNNCQNKPGTPAGLYGPGGQFTDVPIPANAATADGTDNELSIWSPATNELWEFWEAKHVGTHWSACWGGRLNHLTKSPGYFGNGFGASASGLAITGGIVGIADLRAGRIDHALSLAIPAAAIFTNISWPAQRSDGYSSDPNAIAEGTRLRLNPAVNVSTLPGLTPIARMIARSAQIYGFIVTDSAGAVSISAESGIPEKQVTGVNPWASLEQGVPDYLILQNFPWNQMQALPENFGEPSH